MKIGLLKEPEGEFRVALIPEGVHEITGKLKAAVIVEQGAGATTYFTDKDYEDAGAKVMSRSDIFDSADLILGINNPSEEEMERLKPEQVLLTMLQPLFNTELVRKLQAGKKTIFSLDAIPRTHGHRRWTFCRRKPQRPATKLFWMPPCTYRNFFRCL